MRRLRRVGAATECQRRFLGQQIRDALPWRHLLSYVEAILRVYNRWADVTTSTRRASRSWSRALGILAFAKEVEREWPHIKEGPAELTEAKYQCVAASFEPPRYQPVADVDLGFGSRLAREPDFARWVERNVMPHKVPAMPR